MEHRKLTKAREVMEKTKPFSHKDLNSMYKACLYGVQVIDRDDQMLYASQLHYLVNGSLEGYAPANDIEIMEIYKEDLQKVLDSGKDNREFVVPEMYNMVGIDVEEEIIKMVRNVRKYRPDLLMHMYESVKAVHDGKTTGKR